MTATFKTVPYAHQLIALERMKGHKGFALLMEQGTGKTKVIIDDFWRLYQDGEVDTLLILAPNGVHRNWIINEIPAHFNCTQYDAEFWQSSSTSQRKRFLELCRVAVSRNKRPTILAINYDSVGMEAVVEPLDAVLQRTRTYLVCDESSRIKNPKAGRTKRTVSMSRMAAVRRIVTGTPITQGAIDAYAQFAVLDKGIIGSQTFTTFKAEYCVYKTIRLGVGRSFDKLVGYRNLEKLQERMAPFSYRVLKDDCLDLPPKIYEKRYVELTKEQKAAYAAMKAGILASSIGSSGLAFTKMLRLQQLVGGHLYLTDGDTERHEAIPSNRSEGLMELVEELNGKVIIWARFIFEIQAISNALMKGYGKESIVQYYGDVPDVDRAEAVKRFQEDDTCRFFVGQPHSGGIGITLTAAESVVYYSNDFSLETRLQSEDRAHRIGQKKSVVYYDFIATGTVDEHIVRALRNKIDIANIITGDNIKDWI